MKRRRLGSRAGHGALIALILVGANFGVARSATPPHRPARARRLPPLTQLIGGRRVRLFPTPALAASYQRQAGSTNPAAATNMTYHGGRVMLTDTSYAIYWAPPTLQDGTPTDWGVGYTDLIDRYFGDIGGSGLYANNTQYYQGKKLSKRQFIANDSTFGGAYHDSRPYPLEPSSVCRNVYPITDVNTGNCVSDTDIRGEVAGAIAAMGWPVDKTTEFFVFTAPGEGSCYGGKHPTCAYTAYCAFHSYFKNAVAPGVPIVYANMPWADPRYCAGGSAPNSAINATADYTINVTSHEQIEAVTDPLINAWYSAGYNEIADKCAWVFGANSFHGGRANQLWNGHPYELQEEWDNTASACVQQGP